MNYPKGKWEVNKVNTFEEKEVYAIHTYPEPTRIQRVADVFMEANANLIAAAVNACASVNPDNPMAVAESINDMYEALSELMDALENWTTDRQSSFTPVQIAFNAAKPALAKAKG